MAATALVQTRIEPEIKERAASILEKSGLTVSDAVRILLTRTANEGSFAIRPEEPAGYDAWFRAKVQEVLDTPRAGLPHAEMKVKLAKRRKDLMARAEALGE